MSRKSSLRGARRYQSILVPLDGSRLSEQALPIALALAERAGARLRLVLVHRSPAITLNAEGRRLFRALQLTARKFEKTYLETVTDQLKKQSSSAAISSTMLSGPVAGTLREYIRDSRTDLVVMTSRGQGGLRRLWVGSVADATIRGTSVPILLVPPQEKPPSKPVLESFGQILIPLDGSALAETILAAATQVASLAGAEVMLVEVVQPLAALWESQSVAPSKFDVELTSLRRKAASDYLKDVAQECAKAGVKAKHSAPLGSDVADTILGLAESPMVGMIALATHGRGGVKRLALGSVTDKVVRAARCPVLVYRPPGRRSSKRAARR